jgi:Cof subfamily protein (haloacid dehalogenase superfamily)
MLKPYVLASDFDGTLKQHETIRETDRQAIHAFRAAGHRFGVITGRSHTMIASELLAERIPVDFLVCNNGALIYDAEGHLLEETVLDPSTVQGILDLLDQEPDVLYGAGGSHGFFSEFRGTVVSSIATQNIRKHATHRESVLETKHVTAFYLRSKHRERTFELAELILSTYPDVEAHINSDTVDIGPKGHDKGTGILKLATLFPESEIIAIGDHLNDLPMIKAVQSYAIASGHPELQDHAENTVASVSECIDHLLHKK